MLSTVEVMNTETHQWSTAVNLPETMYKASATVYGDQLYMLGGVDKQYKDTKSAYTCSVKDLLQTCTVSGQSQLATSQGTDVMISVWSQIADSPAVRSSYVFFHGRLLAIGGEDTDGFTTGVYMYNSIADSWELVSRMTIGRIKCFSAVLPDNQLMVVGGWAAGGLTATVELATVCDD